MRNTIKFIGHWLGCMALAMMALQLYFAFHIAKLNWVNPESTAFMRSEIWRRYESAHLGASTWQHQWVGLNDMSIHLKKAVLAAEDDGFSQHSGVEWDALEAAWAKNQKRTEKAKQTGSAKRIKLVGGSTITQQLAKNLLLSGERSLTRKLQELALTWMLELMLSKHRILEIYLNSVEWGDGIFGAQAASRQYFGTSAKQLSPDQAARLAVMLPAPKLYSQRLRSTYLSKRAALIVSRMHGVALP
jgi:monofunctional biosynthetic peptidoglycan transglycosylase